LRLVGCNLELYYDARTYEYQHERIPKPDFYFSFSVSKLERGRVRQSAVSLRR